MCFSPPFCNDISKTVSIHILISKSIRCHGVGVDRGLTFSSDNRRHYSGRGEDDKDIILLNSYHHIVSHGIYSTISPIM